MYAYASPYRCRALLDAPAPFALLCTCADLYFAAPSCTHAQHLTTQSNPPFFLQKCRLVAAATPHSYFHMNHHICLSYGPLLILGSNHPNGVVTC